MSRNLHKKLLKRLFLAAFILAALSGIAVFYLETEKVDEHVASLALEESDSLMGHIAFFTAKEEEDFELLRQEVSRHILSEHVITGQFIVVELYNRKKQKAIEVSHPDFTDVFISIAPKLYSDVCLTEEKSLQTTLDGLLARHIVHA